MMDREAINFRSVVIIIAVVAVFAWTSYAYSARDGEADFIFKLFGGQDVSLREQFGESELETLDIKLIEYSIEQFIKVASRWDSPDVQAGLLSDFIKTEDCSGCKNWLAKTKRQLEILTELNRNNPKKLTYIHLSLAYRLSKVLKAYIPEYNLNKFRLLEIIRDRQANCLGYSIMFYVLAKEIGLSPAITLVTRSFNPYQAKVEKIYHSANLIYLPCVENKKTLAIVDVTWNEYVSYPISESAVTITKQDKISRWISFDKKDSLHLVSREFNDYMKAIQISIYTSVQFVDEFSANKGLAERIIYKIVSLDPHNMRFLKMFLLRDVLNYAA